MRAIEGVFAPLQESGLYGTSCNERGDAVRFVVGVRAEQGVAVGAVYRLLEVIKDSDSAEVSYVLAPDAGGENVRVSGVLPGEEPFSFPP